MGEPNQAELLSPADIRALADRLGIRPTKSWGQNFLHDPNTIRRIVRTAGVDATDVVLEVGPGLGSLTLGLLTAARQVVAVEIDPTLATALPATIAARASELQDRLVVRHADATTITDLVPAPTALVANLPYNVAVPILLHLLATFPTLRQGLIMVQAEVADRLVAAPGSKIYGVPSAKLAWYASSRRAGTIPRQVFWPVPNVDSALVAFERRDPPSSTDRREVFAIVDAAFAQRRKTLRAALAPFFGSPDAAAHMVTRAGIDPTARGESLTIAQFAAIAAAKAIA